MTDLASLALQGFVALGSAGAGVLAISWRLSSQLQAIRSELQTTRAELATERGRITKLDADLDTFREGENEQWQILNRTLGQIEGRLDPTARPPQRSRP